MNMNKLIAFAAVAAAETPRRGSLLYNRFVKASVHRAAFGVFGVLISGGLLAADMTVAEDWTLDSDQVVDTLTVNEGVTVYLNGHTLTAKALAGTGTVMSAPHFVPAGYTELEYIESTNSAYLVGTYIDTGVKPLPEGRIVADIVYNGDVGGSAQMALISASIAGSGVNAKSIGIWALGDGSGKSTSTWAVKFNGNDYRSTTKVSLDSRCTIEATWKNSSRTLYCNGSRTLDDTASVSPTAVNHNMFICGRNYADERFDSGASIRIYSFKIYNPQNELVRDYVPARRLSDGEVGLYDLKSEVFFAHGGESPFAASAKEYGAGGGELRLNPTSNFTNSGVALAGTLKLVKKGNCVYTSSKKQSYTGGTLLEGTERVYFTPNGGNTYCGFGAWGAEVVIASNAQVRINKFDQTLNGYKVTIAGDGYLGDGAIYGNKAGAGPWDGSYIGGLTLSGDASIGFTGLDSFALSYKVGSANEAVNVTLNGHVLTLKGTEARCIVSSVKVLDEGKIVASISPGNLDGATYCLYTGGTGLTAPFADLTVPAGAALGGATPIIVKSLLFGGTYYPYKGITYTVTVLERYTPMATSGGLPYVALGDATHLSPTLDLSSYDTTVDGDRLSYAAGSTVVVLLGNRRVSTSTPIISWEMEPSDVAFVSGDGGRKYRYAKRTDGLYRVGSGLTIIVK